MAFVPTEILCDIFLRAVLSSPRFGSASSSIAIPLSVSRVCRRWRDISLSFGELWTHLSVEFEYDLHVPGDYRGDRWVKYRNDIVEIFDTWLQRTNGHPLNFGIACRLIHHDDVETRAAARSLFTKLLTQQQRWKDVHIEWMDPYVTRELWDIQHISMANMPLLTSLTMVWDNFYHAYQGVPHKVSARVDVSCSPLLRQLNLDGRFALRCSDTPSKELVGPVLLRFDEGAVDDDAIRACRKLLEVAPSITQFEAVFDDRGPAPVRGLSRARRLELSELHTLCLRLERASDPLLSSLSLPSLQALACDGPWENGEGGEILKDMIIRCAPPLTCLVLDNFPDEETLISILRLTPALELLSLSDGVATERLFRELAAVDQRDLSLELEPSRNYPILCPSLRLFRGGPDSRGISDFDAFADVFIEMLISRQSAINPFKWISLDLYEGYSPIDSVLEYLEDWRTKLRSRTWYFWIRGDNAPDSFPFPTPALRRWAEIG